MHAAVLALLLAGGVPPTTSPNARPAVVSDAPGDRAVSGTDMSVDSRHPASRPVPGGPSYVSYTDYPGAPPKPVNRWHRHAYLTSRGSYYQDRGYDFRRQFDYPWYTPPYQRYGLLLSPTAPPPGEAIHTPAAEPETAKPQLVEPTPATPLPLEPAPER